MAHTTIAPALPSAGALAAALLARRLLPARRSAARARPRRHAGAGHRHRRTPRRRPTSAGWGDVPLRGAAPATVDRQRSAARPRRAAPGRPDAVRSLGQRRLQRRGYWDYLTVRGFVLDNRFNYRRDGLPISAETVDPARQQGAHRDPEGHQRHPGRHQRAGRPGQLRRQAADSSEPLRRCASKCRERGSVLGAVDLGGRFGADQRVRLRLNAAREHLRPDACATLDGDRNLLALAGDWRLAPRHADRGRDRVQPPARSPARPASACSATACRRRSIRASTSTTSRGRSRRCSTRTPARCASRRRSAPTGAGRAARHAAPAHRRPRSPSRSAAAPPTALLPDRYCSDGTFDLYDFRSENERRRTDALDLVAAGQRSRPAPIGARAGARRAAQPRAQPLPAPGLQLRRHRQRRRHGRRAGRPDADRRQHRPRRALDRAVRCATRSAGPTASPPGSACATRRSTATACAPTAAADRLRDGLTTPWLAAELRGRTPADGVCELGPGRRIARSCPTVPRYSNAGEALPALRAAQTEIGLKGGDRRRWPGSSRCFDIQRPVIGDIGACDDSARHLRAHKLDGNAAAPRHGGQRAMARRAVELHGGVQWLHARREGSSRPDASTASGRPTCRRAALRAAGRLRRAPPCPAWQLQAGAHHESAAHVLPDNSVAHRPAGPASTRRCATTQRIAGTPTGPGGRHRQPARPPRLARVALPVRPRLPVPARAAHVAPRRCRSTSEPRPETLAIIRGCSSIAQLVERRTVNP